MPRELSTEYQNSLDASYSSEVDLIFLTASHPNLLEPIRVVNDAAQPNGTPIIYRRDGVDWSGMPFWMVLLTDDDSPPAGELVLLNVDRRVGETVQLLVDSPAFTIEMLRGSAFTREPPPDDHIFAATAPVVELAARHLRMLRARHEGPYIHIPLGTFDYSREPYPGKRATRARFPGLYR
jgi:hypothetical protein